MSLITDDYGYETSFQLIGPQGGIISRAPVNNQKLRDNRAYTFQYCVNAGSKYKFKIIDKKGDGLVSNLCLSICILESTIAD